MLPKFLIVTKTESSCPRTTDVGPVGSVVTVRSGNVCAGTDWEKMSAQRALVAANRKAVIVVKRPPGDPERTGQRGPTPDRQDEMMLANGRSKRENTQTDRGDRAAETAGVGRLKRGSTRGRM